MKRICSLIAVLLVAAGGSLYAAEPPELEEWFYIDGQDSWMLGGIGKEFSYLPDFEPARGGTNATLVQVHTSVPTWYNRYHGDTINQFSWPVLSGRDMRKADLNADGVDEYISRNGLLHRGITQGEPPEREFINYNSLISSLVPLHFHDV